MPHCCRYKGNGSWRFCQRNGRKWRSWGKFKNRTCSRFKLEIFGSSRFWSVGKL